VTRAPEVPGPESLYDADALRGADEPPPYPFWTNLETRVLDSGRFRERRRGEPVWREWYRFRPRATFDDPFLDAGRSLLLIDTLSWPAASRPHLDSPFMAPNLDVSAWFHRAEPESEWLLVDHESPVAEGGVMGTVGRVWSQSGRLLASGGAQLLCTPLP
jgi:acyl-CoA thioesterase-2